MKRPGRGLIYLSVIAVFGLVSFFSSEQASAAGDCSISMSGTGLTRTFTLTANPPGPPANGLPGRYWINGVSGQTRTITYPGYGTYTVNGRTTGAYRRALRVGFVVEVFDYSCSRTFTIVRPNQQALAWLTNINCSAAGALTFTANVADPDGGSPSYHVFIGGGVGDTGWITRPNGSYGHGAYYPPRNGATYSILIWAKDAQTGTEVGPGGYTYSCPAPPPNRPATGSVSSSCDAAGVLFVTVAVSDPDGGTPGWSIHIDNIADLPTDWGGGKTLGPYSPRRDGVTYNVFIHVVDPQTNGIYGPFSSTYNCPQPPPSLSANCANASGIAAEPGGRYYPQFVATRSGANTESVTINVSMTIAGMPAVTRSGTSATPANGTYSFVDSGGVPGPGTRVNFSGVNNGVPTPTANDYLVTYAWSYSTPTLGATAGAPCTVTLSVKSRPYFKVLGGDIITRSSNNSILGWNQALGIPALGYEPGFSASTNGQLGAGTQGMIMSAGTTSGVASRFMSPTLSLGPRTLTLSNTPPTPAGAYNPTWGGAFGVPYLMPEPVIPNRVGLVGVNSVAGIASGEYNLSAAAGGALSGGNIAAGTQATVYVAGNVRITSNITYTNAGSYASIAAIPHFRLVATGHIFVDPAVSRLDGEYIAGNGSGVAGNVYTCFAAGWTTPIVANIYNDANCRNITLLVNGSLVGDSVKLTRVVGTLRNATSGDGTLNPALSGVAAYQNSGNLSEIIQFTPELFLRPPAGQPTAPAGNRYDSITALPPIF